MRTFYIDVYFLINLTVDILALYFSAIFSKTPTSIKRLLIAGIIGAASAVFVALMPDIPLLKLLIKLLLKNYHKTTSQRLPLITNFTQKD